MAEYKWSKLLDNKACECNKEQRRRIRDIAKQKNITIARHHYRYPNVYLEEFTGKCEIRYTQRNSRTSENILDFVSFAEFEKLLLSL